MSSLRNLVPFVAVSAMLGCSLEHPSTIGAPRDSGTDVTIDTPAEDVPRCGMLGQACCAQDSAAVCATGLACMGGTCVMGRVCPSPSEVSCNGTCVNTMTSATDCGRCGNICRAGANSTASCAMGGCRVACNDGFGDCNNDPTDGCEVNLRSDTSNCGVCNNPCSVSNGRSVCTMGRCAVGSCDANFFDCDSSYGNGCETDTRTSLMHCGGCGMACPSGPNSTATCTTATCGLTCAAGFGNCDGIATNGCETNLNTSVGNCGRCANVCPVGTGGAPSCNMGSCGFGCGAGRGDCNGTVADGCETDILTSTANCGRCGNACSFNNASATCAAGMCALGTCSAGFQNCNGNAMDGCEINVNNNAAHCGGCGMACPGVTNGASVCTSGVCGVVCNTGYAVVGLACVAVSAPRPIAPMSTSIVTSRRPTFRWALGADMDGALVEICSDRACTARVTQITALGNTGTVASDLMPGTYFWHLFGRLSGTTSTASSPTWQFTVGARSAPVTNAYGSVADVNGDGLADVIVGARAANRAYVHFGARGTFPTASSQTLDGMTGAFGQSVASAGDTNGDGFGDVIVGTDTGGFANVYYGSASGLIVGSPTRLAGAAASGFGFSVTSIGDFNGDGYGDVAVGAKLSNTVFVYQGSASGVLPSALLTIPSPVADVGAAFGVSVGNAGDVNADGFSDLVVGANGLTANNAWIYHGGTMPSRTPTTILGPGGNYFGTSVSGAGDLNGDGFCDLVIGALNGSVALFRGSASGVMPMQTLTNTDAGYGVSVASLGDVNADGFSDIIVGTFSNNVYAYYGAATTLPNSPSVVLAGAASSGFGISVSGAGDTNGDTFSDAIVGAYSAGQAMLFRGAMSGLPTTASATLAGPAGSQFGIFVASYSPRRRVRFAVP